jgi:hypothetical protein
MTRFAALLAKNPGDPFGLTNYVQLKTDHDYLIVAGADQASGATVPVVAEFFGVTGTTTITNLNDAAGASAGQQVRLWIKNGPLTIQNNGGGSGNIRTQSGADIVVPQNAIIEFAFDSVNSVWREQRRPFSGEQIDYAQITANISTIANGTFTVAITGNSVAYDGSKVRIEVYLAGFYVGGGASPCRISLFKDGVEVTMIVPPTSSAAADLRVGNFVYYDTPTAANHTYSVQITSDGANTTRIDAGAGGANTLSPSFLRTTRA